MQAKIIEKQLCRHYRKKGLSFKEIQSKVQISKSSISLWCGDIKLTNNQILRLKNKKPKRCKISSYVLNRRQEIKNIEFQARKEIQQLTLEQFKLIGIALYWGEGDKKHYVGITNSDPELIKFMMAWFRIICKIPKKKFRASIYYHFGQNEKIIQKY